MKWDIIQLLKHLKTLENAHNLIKFNLKFTFKTVYIIYDPHSGEKKICKLLLEVPVMVSIGNTWYTQIRIIRGGFVLKGGAGYGGPQGTVQPYGCHYTRPDGTWTGVVPNPRRELPIEERGSGLWVRDASRLQWIQGRKKGDHLTHSSPSSQPPAGAPH